MCKRLREVTLGSGLTDMKSNAFEGCVGISKVICHGTYEQFEKLLDVMFVTTHEFVFTEDRQEDQE